MRWTKENVEKTKELWALGKSASEIAGEIGADSRNAVMGKLNRLGLLGFKKKAQSMRKKQERATKLVVAQKVIPPQLIEPVVYDPEAWKCTIDRLTAETCHWMRDDSMYCGMPTREGAPYCSGHCKMAYQPSRARGPQHWRGKR